MLQKLLIYATVIKFKQIKEIIMANLASVSANIPKELSDILDKVATIEERSKSYYIKKGLEKVLGDRLEDLDDYEDAKQEYDEFMATGKKSVSFAEVFENIK